MLIGIERFDDDDDKNATEDSRTYTRDVNSTLPKLPQTTADWSFILLDIDNDVYASHLLRPRDRMARSLISDS